MRKLASVGSVVMLGALLACVLPVQLFAQADRGTITGAVTDSTGAIIINASVKATNVATGFEMAVATNASGIYQLSNLPIGVYKISVSAHGFGSYERLGFELTVAQTARLDVALKVGQVAEHVTVEANAEQLNTSDSMMGATVQSKLVTDMPQAFHQEGRVIENFAFAITPGVEGDPANSTASYMGHVDGSQAFTKDVLIDGISAHTHIIGDNMETAPAFEAVQEFKVQTTGMSAEYGRNTGGTFNFALKSGTNQFHGSGFYYGRNEALNANSWMSNHILGTKYGNSPEACDAAYAPGSCPYKRQRDRNRVYGFSVGAPVRIPHLYNGKDKTFIFGTFERYEQEQMGLGALARTVPTAAFLNGDFSALLTTTQKGTDALGRPIYLGAIYDPTTMRKVGSTWVSDPFLGNIIPANRISSLSKKIIALYKAGPYQPVNNALSNNFLAPANQQPWFHENQMVYKVDHNLSASNRVSGSFIWSERPRVSVGNSGLWQPQFGSEGGPLNAATYDMVTGRRLTVSDNWTIHSHIINTLSLAFNRYVKRDHSGTVSFGDWPASQGLTQAKSWPEYLGLTNYTVSTAMPQIGFGSAVNGIAETGFGGGAPGGWAGQTYILSDSVAWLHGKHSFKVGGEAWHMQLNAAQYSENSLRFTFQPTATGIPGNTSTGFGFASFLLGQVNDAQRAVPTTSHPRRNYFDLYFQDDYKATQKLTLNLGLRWEQAESLTTTDNRFTNFNVNKLNTALNIPGAYDWVSSSQRTFDGGKQWTNFAPRVGFAYALGTKSVIRGAYGIYYAPMALEYWFGVPYAGYGGTAGFVSIDKINQTGNLPVFSWDSPGGGGFYPSTGIVAAVKDANTPVWGTSRVDPESLKLGYTHQFNIGFERSLSANDLVTVSFVGNIGRRLHDATLRRNQPTRDAYEQLPAAAQKDWMSCPNTSTVIDGVRCPYVGFWGQPGMALQPFPQVALTYGPLYYTDSPLGSSSYNSLQVTYNRRMSKGLASQVSYTFSKTKGNSETNFQENYPSFNKSTPGVQDMYNLGEAADTVVSYDQTHIFKGLIAYELPFGRGRTFLSNAPRAVDAILGGWTVSTILRYNTGFPLPVSPNAVSYPGWEGYIYANVTPGANIGRKWSSSSLNIDDLSKAGAYFDTSAFSNPTFPKLGNGRRYYDSLRGFGYSNEDMGLMKYFKVGERLNFQLRAEFINAFNRHHLSNPDTNIGDGIKFGKVLGVQSGPAFDPRGVQIGLRVGW